ncbi:MAG: serine/threonine-protein phosphatase [Clostridiales bacterium]|nr:serine/threonine-protein phosphatase [Clostridiales bacterium]
MRKLKIEAAGITDIGIAKKVNQDSFLYKITDIGESYAGIFAVADGVGGLDFGEVASTLAISNLNSWWEQDFKSNIDKPINIINSLIFTFKKSNKEILQYSLLNGIRTATTLSVLLIYNNYYYVIHTGDSRIYKIDSKIQCLTKDYCCYVNKIVNGVTYRRSLLTACLGAKEELDYFCASDQISKNDLFIICSDGVYKTISDKDILKLIKKNKRDLKLSCETLINEAKLRGEKDNITMIACRIIR